jgi:hypothetical protein
MYAGIMADADASIAKGELAGTSGDLSRLTGRPTTPIAETITAALDGKAAMRLGTHISGSGHTEEPAAWDAGKPPAD